MLEFSKMMAIAVFAAGLAGCNGIDSEAPRLPQIDRGKPISGGPAPVTTVPCKLSESLRSVEGPARIKNDPKALVNLLYQALLWRDADFPGADGAVHAVEQGNIVALISDLANSDEFKRNIGSYFDRADIVAHFYETLLGRAADSDGKASWVNGNLSYGQIAGAFACSSEFLQRSRASIYADEMVRLVYQGILWRDADKPGSDGWRDEIFMGRVAGVGFKIAESGEFRSDIAGTKDRETIVRHFYEVFLGREIDPSGFDSFVTDTRLSLPEVASIILSSAEFRAHPPAYLGSIGRGKRSGPVRLEGHSPTDDGGQFNALGASLFWALWAAKYDEPKLRRNLQYLADHGFHYIRALAQVGCPNADGSGDGSCGPLYPWGTTNWFHGRVINPRWPDYDEQLKRLMDIAYDDYGLRIEWTIFGGVADMYGFFGEDEPRRVIEAVARATQGREEKVMHFQIGNELWQTGLPFADDAVALEKLRTLTRYLKSMTAIPVSITDPVGDDCSYAGPLYAGGIADLVSFHYDRSYTQGGWGSVAQPWDSCGYRFVSNNEPIGPGASVASEADPYKLVSAAVTSFVSNVGFYVYHTEAGVWGGTRGQKADLDEYDPRIAEGFSKMHSYLPADLSSWNRQAIGWPGYPFEPGFGGTTSWGAPASGSALAYGATKGDQFFINALGVGRYEMRAKSPMSVDVIDPVEGSLLRHADLGAGEVLVLEGLPAFVLKGTYEGMPPVSNPFCSGGRLVDPRGYFYSLIGRREGDPALDWVEVLNRSGIPAGFGPGVRPPDDAPFYGLTQQIGSGGPRGRLFLPTDTPDELGYFSHPVDILIGDAMSMRWQWRDLGGPPYAAKACQ
jgi:hypothetical protein